MYDIEQIIFNAKLYNPVSAKDYRSRNIIHVANSLIDVIETHAYNFKKELGSDVFKRCDEISRRTNYSEPKFIDRNKMHPENFKYYAEVIGAHRKQKVEMILENECNLDSEMNQETIQKLALAMTEANVWKCNKCSSINENEVRLCNVCNSRKATEDGRVTRSESQGSSRDSRIDLFDFPDPEPPRKKRSTSATTTTSTSISSQTTKVQQCSQDKQDKATDAIDKHMGDSHDGVFDGDTCNTNLETQNFVKISEMVEKSADTGKTDIGDVETGAVLQECDQNTLNQAVDESRNTKTLVVTMGETPSAKENVVDFDSMPFMVTLKKSVWLSLQPSSAQRLQYLQSSIESTTKNWNFQSTMALMADLNRAVRNFQAHVDWNLLMDTIAAHVIDANNFSGDLANTCYLHD